MGDDFNLATLIVGILSLIGVVSNICVTVIADRKRRYTNLITTHRIANMKNVEKLISKLINNLYSFLVPVDKVEEFKNFELNKQEILYAIGTEGYPENEIREVLCNIDKLLFAYSVDKRELSHDQRHKFFDIIKVGIECFQSLTRLYTKCEWEKCKHTSLYGTEKKFDKEKLIDSFPQAEKEKIASQIKFLAENDYDYIKSIKD